MRSSLPPRRLARYPEGRERRGWDGRSLRLAAGWAIAAGVGIVLALRALDALAHLGLLLLISWLIAVAAEPGIGALERRGMKRGGAVALIASATIAVLLAIVAILGGTLVSQLDELTSSAPKALDAANGWIVDISGGAVDVKALTGGNLGTLLGKAGSGALGALGSVLVSVFDAVTVAVFAMYLAVGAPGLQRKVARLLPARQQQVLVEVWSIAVAKAGGFVMSKIALAGISAAAHTGAFYVLDVPYWLPMGLFAGVVSQFVPVIGTYVGVALPAVLALEVNPWTALWVVVFATMYQQIENYVLTPRISSKTMDLNGGLALAAVLAGVALVGPAGALIGMPLAAIIDALVETYAHRYDLHPEVARQIPSPRRRRRVQ